MNLKIRLQKYLESQNLHSLVHNKAITQNPNIHKTRINMDK
jgi:hypothetical protein